MLQWLRSWFDQRDADEDLAREIRTHLELEAEEQADGGMSAVDAAYAARRGFGNPTTVRQICRESRPFSVVEDFLHDARYGVRMLARNPGFTAVAVLILGVAIGVNTAVFTAFDALALRPLQARDPERVVNVYRTTKENRYGDFFSFNEYAAYRDQAKTLSGIVAVTSTAASMTTRMGGNQPAPGGASGAFGFHFPALLTKGSAEPLISAVVSENYFSVMGISAALGRTFSAQDAHGPNSDPVLVLSYEFWQHRFDANPAIIGTVIELNRHPFTVIGVLPAGYLGTFSNVPNAWLPLSMQPQLESGRNWLEKPDSEMLRLYGRLGPGLTREQAEAEMTAVTHRVAELNPDKKRELAAARITLTRGWFGGPPPGAEEIAMVLFALAAVGLLLVIACANVASLMLARAAARTREIAVRLALGAGRRRLIRQLLTESMLLSVLAGAAGVLFSWWVLRLLINAVSNQIPPYWGTIALQLTPDPRIFAYALGLSCVAAVAFGLVPALRASKPDLVSALKQDASTATRHRGRWLRFPKREVLITVQIAVCLVLLISAGLLARSSGKALTVDTGYDMDHLIAMELLKPSNSADDSARLAAIEEQLLRRLQAIPEASSVTAAVHSVFMAGDRSTAIAVGDHAVVGPGSPSVFYSEISPEFFRTFGIRMVQGRGFTAAECRAGAPVAIVSDATARRFWPGESAVGKRIAIGGENWAANYFSEVAPSSPSTEIIGVAADARLASVSSTDPTHLYLPWKPGLTWPSFYVRTAGDSAAVLPGMREAVRATAPDLIAVSIEGRAAITNDPAFVLPRLGAILCGMVSLLGMVLAAVGIYGTISWAVNRRTPEIGIRMALGAHRGNVLALVLGETLRPVLWGVAVGFVLAGAAARVMTAVLFGVSPLDPITFGGAALFLTTVALLAAYGPARRATVLDPMAALRHE